MSVSMKSILTSATALATILATSLPAGCGASATICTQQSESLAGQPLQTRDLPGKTRPEATECKSRIAIVRSLAQLRAAYVDVGLVEPNSNPNAPIDGVSLPPIDFSRQSVVLIEGAHDVAIRFLLADGATVTIGTQTCSATEISQCDARFYLVDVLADVAKEHVCSPLDCTGAGSVQAF